jgi:hypothetical protein
MRSSDISSPKHTSAIGNLPPKTYKAVPPDRERLKNNTARYREALVDSRELVCEIRRPDKPFNDRTKYAKHLVSKPHLNKVAKAAKLAERFL